jgi:hypothetical protein
MRMANIITSICLTNRKFLILLLVLGSLIVFDRIIFPSQLTVEKENIFFSIGAIIGVVGQFLLLSHVRSTSNAQKQELDIHRSSYSLNLVFIIFVVVSAILVTISIQLNTLGYYYASELFILLTPSLGLGILVAFSISIKFLRYRQRKKTFSVLLFGLMVFVFAVNTGFTLGANLEAIIHTNIVKPYRILYYYTIPDPVHVAMTTGAYISYMVSLVLAWIFSMLMLKAHYKVAGKIKTWVLICVPILYLVIYPWIIPILGKIDFHFFILVPTVSIISKVAPAIALGLMLWLIGLKNSTLNEFRKSLFILGSGLFLYFISQNAFLFYYDNFIVHPGFGLITLTFLGVSLYMISISADPAGVFFSDLRSRME